MGIETRRGVPASFCLRPARRRAQSGAFLHHIGQPSWAAGSIWCIFAPHRPTLEDCRPNLVHFCTIPANPRGLPANLVHFCTTSANSRGLPANLVHFCTISANPQAQSAQSGAFLHHNGQPSSPIGPIWCIFAPHRPTLEPNRPNLVHFCTTSAPAPLVQHPRVRRSPASARPVLLVKQTADMVH